MRYLQIPVKQYKHRCFSVWFMYHWLLYHYISLKLSSCFWHSPVFLMRLVALRIAACNSAGLAVPEHTELWLALEVPSLHLEHRFHVTGSKFSCLLMVGLNDHKGLFHLKLFYDSVAIFYTFGKAEAGQTYWHFQQQIPERMIVTFLEYKNNWGVWISWGFLLPR